MNIQNCQYNKCKAIAEFKTPFGYFCPYHFKVLNKKKGLTGENLNISKTEKEVMKHFKLMPNVIIKTKLGRSK